MTQHKTTTARELRPGHVVVAYPDDSHPDRYGEPGTWTIVQPDEHIEREIGDRIRIEYDGGMWALHPDQPVIREYPVREMQQETTAVLADLLRIDLPEMTWKLSAYMSRPALEGQARSDMDDDDAVKHMQAWAAFLGTEVATTEHDDHVSHKISGEHMGVQVRIFTHTRQAYTYQRVSKEAQS